MKPLLRAFKALADPNRLHVMKLLEDGRRLCVCEIVAALGLAQPTVSKHLKILEEAGLLSRFKDGPWVNYTLADPKAPDAPAWLGGLFGLLAAEGNADPGVRGLLALLPTLDRAALCAAKPRGT